MQVATGTIASTDPAADTQRVVEALRPQRRSDESEPRTVGTDRTNVPLTPEHSSPVRDNADEALVEFTDGSLLRLTPSPGVIRVETQVPDDVDMTSFQDQVAARIGMPVSWLRD
ncbi:hypothetical protein GCM10009599_09150 [Luteococcus peritonei]